MPTILPISDLRNYTDVLKRVDVGKPVYLTRNGRGTYVVSKIDEYDKDATVEELVSAIKYGEDSVQHGEPIPISQVAQDLDLAL